MPTPLTHQIIDPPMSPSRATSAFHRTVRTLLHERASDYVMWVAGHGGEASTVTSYLSSVRVFPSHFDEWCSNLNRETILASIPALRTLMPGIAATHAELPDVIPVPVPKIVETVVALAIQQHIMAHDRYNKGISGSAPKSNAVMNISGHHSPASTIDLLSALSTTPIQKFTIYSAMGTPNISGFHAPILVANEIDLDTLDPKDKP